MTIPYGDALNALSANSAPQMVRILAGLTLTEQVELGTFIGPVRLPAVADYAVNSHRGEAPAEARLLSDTLHEIHRQAFGNAAEQRASNHSSAAAIDRAIAEVAARRRGAPLLTMPNDVTHFLPTPRVTPPPLGEADYQGAAARNNLEVAAIKAVASVESSGDGFDDHHRPKILFEAHKFGNATNNRFNRTHPQLGLRQREWRQSRNFYRWNQYQRLHEAMLLDLDGALSAASWGRFQVLGENHNGWPDVRSFVRAMYENEGNHLKAFIAYCDDNNLLGHIRARNWKAFAEGYNGSGQQGYDRRMAEAYRGFSRAP